MPRTFALPLILAATLVSAQTPVPPLAGFTSAGAAQEYELEKKFDASLSRQNLDQWLKDFSSKPHHVGSPAGKVVAWKIAALLKSWGYETEIETFYPLFPTPRTRRLEMITSITPPSSANRPSRATRAPPTPPAACPPTTLTRSTAT